MELDQRYSSYSMESRATKVSLEFLRLIIMAGGAVQQMELFVATVFRKEMAAIVLCKFCSLIATVAVFRTGGEGKRLHVDNMLISDKQRKEKKKDFYFRGKERKNAIVRKSNDTCCHKSCFDYRKPFSWSSVCKCKEGKQTAERSTLELK